MPSSPQNMGDASIDLETYCERSASFVCRKVLWGRYVDLWIMFKACCVVFMICPLILIVACNDVCFLLFFLYFLRWEPHETAERFGSSRSIVGPELLKITARFSFVDTCVVWTKKSSTGVSSTYNFISINHIHIPRLLQPQTIWIDTCQKPSGHVAVVLNAVPRLPPECPNSLDEVKVKKLWNGGNVPVEILLTILWKMNTFDESVSFRFFWRVNLSFMVDA